METNRKVGRPTNYNELIQFKADSYLFRLEELGHVVPSRVGLCCFLGISKRASFDYERDYPAFAATLRSVETMQEHLALNGGITGRLNSTIVKLLLANHGYSDRQAVAHSSPDGSMTPAKTLDASALSDDALKELMDARRSGTE